MWFVRLALRRPYTFVVMAMLIVLFGVFTIQRTPKDILPEVDIPVVVVVWTYGGLPPEEMEKRVVSGFERFLITVVNDIEHTESQSLTGVSIIKVFFHPGAKIEAAVAQVTACSQTALRSLPPGATPPLILRYSAANAPVLSVLDTSLLWVRAYVPENHLDIATGRVVEVTVDSYADKVFPGEVTFVSSQAEFTPGNVQTPEERSKQVFRIKVQLRAELGELRPGMAADVWLEPRR